MFFFESFLSLSNFCLWLLWSKKLEAGTFFFVWIQMHYCTRHQNNTGLWPYSHTHIQYNNSTEKSWDRSQNSFLCLSIHVWMHISRVALHHLAAFCLPEREAQEFQVLCRQVWYDQFFHFPNFSRNLKLLRFIVIIKWPGNTTERTDIHLYS